VTGKLDIKVTIDEDVFPDLYRRLIEIDNPRARAGVFKRLADDHVRGVDTAAAAPEVRLRVTKSRVEAAAELPSKATVPIERVKPVGPNNADDHASNDALSRFQADAIAEQFAAF